MADSETPEIAQETVPAAGPAAPAWLTRLARRPFALLAVLGFLLWLPGVLSLPALDRDESRFAQSSRQMVESGDVVDIRFGHFHQHNRVADRGLWLATNEKIVGLEFQKLKPSKVTDDESAAENEEHDQQAHNAR